MSDELLRLRNANPVPVGLEPHAVLWSDDVLLAEIDRRSGIEMAFDQDTQTQLPRTPAAHRRWAPALIATTAFVVVLGLMGVIALIVDDGNGDVADIPSTTAAPPTTAAVPTTTAAPATTAPTVPLGEPLNDAQAAFVQSFFDAWNTDVESYLEMLSPDAEVVVQYGVWHPFAVDGPQRVDLERFEAIARWGAALETRATTDVDACIATDGHIKCTVSVSDIFMDAAGSPVAGAVRFGVEDGGIRTLRVTWNRNDYYGATGDFVEWLRANHPEDGKKMAVASGEPIYTSESAELWLEHIPEYFRIPVPLTDAQAAFVQSFFDAWNTDIESYLDLIAADAELTEVGTVKYGIWVEDPVAVSREKFEARARWEAAIGTESIVALTDCVDRGGSVVCPFRTSDVLLGGVLGEIQAVMTLEAVDGRVGRLRVDWKVFNNGGSVVDFRSWVEATYPDTIGRDWSGFTADQAALWNEYAPLYIASRR